MFYLTVQSHFVLYENSAVCRKCILWLNCSHVRRAAFFYSIKNQSNFLLRFIFIASVIFYVEDCWVDSIFSSGIIPWTLAVEKRMCLRDGDGGGGESWECFIAKCVEIFFPESLVLEWFWEIYSLLELDFTAKIEQNIPNNNGLNERRLILFSIKFWKWTPGLMWQFWGGVIKTPNSSLTCLSLSVSISVFMGQNGCWGSKPSFFSTYNTLDHVRLPGLSSGVMNRL